jgi:hypothetical protein
MSLRPDQPPDAAHDPALSAELARAVDARHAAADLDGVYAALHADFARERGPRGWLRERATVVRGLAAVGLVALLCAVVAFGFARPDLDSYPLPRMALSVSAIASLMIVCLVLALRPLQRPALPPWAASAAVGGSLLVLAALYLVAPFEAQSAALDAGALRAALACMAVGLLLGVPVYGALLLLDRGGSQRALPMAIAAGLAANLVLHIHCPSAEPTHLMLGHFGAAALLLIAIALWARTRG